MLAIAFYDILKFFHVALAIVWIGGAVMMQIMAEFALRSKLPGRAAEFAREVEQIGTKLFVPASLVLVGLGFWLVEKASWGYHFWVVASLVLFAASFVTGAGFLGPQSGKLAKLIEAEGPEAPVVKARIRTIVNVARGEALVLFAVVFLMVTKIGQ